MYLILIRLDIIINDESRNLSLKLHTLRYVLASTPASIQRNWFAPQKLDLRLRVFSVPDKKSHSAPFSAFMFIPTLLISPCYCGSLHTKCSLLYAGG